MIKLVGPLCLAALISFELALARLDFDESLNQVYKDCDKKMKHINSIHKFNEFVYHYKFMLKNFESPKGVQILLNSSDKRFKRCYEEQESILELEKLIQERKRGLCRQSYISKLIDYHLKYIFRLPEGVEDRDQQQTSGGKANNSQEANRSRKSSYTRHIFSYFAHQVAYSCKMSIPAKLREAQREQDCSVVLTKGLPHIFAFKDQKMAGSERETFADISSFLDTFDRVEDFVPVEQFRSGLGLVSSPVGFYELLVADEAIERIEELKKLCKAREPYYKVLFSPVARLAQLGYTVDSEYLKVAMSAGDKKLLKCWLASAQLCQGVLRAVLSVNSERELSLESNSKLVTINWVAPYQSSGRGGSDTEEQEGSRFELDGSLKEISPWIISHVREKFTFKRRVKARALSYLKKQIKNHLDVEAMQQEAERNLLNAIAEGYTGMDSRVAFAGKKFDSHQYNPTSIFTRHLNHAVKASSAFWGRNMSLILGSIEGIVLSGAFIWFSLYALTTLLKNQLGNLNTANFKAEYLQMRQKKIDEINKSATSMFHFYKPN